ncbi:ABC transporter permease [Microbacterium candidum]|uniref:ABC transporter permease n=1 Tax=Microbacterium candidum TaxID=3041922 RepID=A0ABT7N107_9MICO|nr:ABC transporter permease [Microbacterium sp. ASV49]MDL9980391.1 ABC transporter permease [Microbacterium sp. ASV49]
MTQATGTAEQASRRPSRSSSWTQMVASFATPPAIVGLSIVAFFTFASVFANWLMPYSTTEPSCAVFEPPSPEHWLGCDDGGIDVLSLVILGGRVSMVVGFVAAVISIVIGATVGVLSGYFGGWVDSVLMRITDYFIVIPQIVLMIVVAAVWGPSLVHVIIVIGLLMWTSTARVIRAQAKTLRERVYVRRTVAIGAGNTRVIVRHVLPQLGPLLIANAVLAITVAIFNETALAFLGLSDPTAVTWGTIMEHAFERDAVSTGAWWAIVPAGVGVALLIMGCYLIGNSIEDALNPRLRVSYLSAKSWRLRPLVGRGKDEL